MRVLVIGGKLFIGRHLTGQLLEAGHEVTILHRRPGHDLGEAVQELIGDRNNIDSLAGVLAGHRFDAVFDNVYDWQRGTTAAQVEAMARACGGGDLHRYVFMSSVGAYQEGLGLTEESPLAPEDDPNSYARNKASSERALFRLHKQEGLPAVTLRPPFVYGPDNPFYREAFFWDRLADNRPILVPGDGQRPMHMVYVKDIVRACMAALERPEAVGRSFNVADERPVTQDELVRALARAAGPRSPSGTCPEGADRSGRRKRHGSREAVLRHAPGPGADHGGDREGAAVARLRGDSAQRRSG